MSRRTGTTVVLALVALFGALPIGAYWLVVGRAPMVSAATAGELLARPGAILVDVRPAETYAASHIEEAVNWPLPEIMALPDDQDLPPHLRHRQPMLLLCDSGFLSARAALRLAPRLPEQVFTVRGGLAEWTAATPACPLAFARLQLAGGESTELPHRDSSLVEQWGVTLSAFVLKPFYMGLSLLLIAVLRRASSPDLVNLRHGLVSFLAGETFCAINFLVFGEGSYLVEYLHAFGMVLAFGFTTLALVEATDGRLLHINGTGRCAVLPLCTSCIKNDPSAPCGAQRLMLWLIPLLAVIALMPVTAMLHDDAYTTTILGTPYHHHHPLPFQVFEIRYLPVAAILLLAASFMVLRFQQPAANGTAADRVSFAKQLFAHGVGFLGFAVFRFIIYSAYRSNQAWYIVWEELLELLSLLACAVVLWQFRRGLLAPGRAAPD